jgi:hypothetical protein
VPNSPAISPYGNPPASPYFRFNVPAPGEGSPSAIAPASRVTKKEKKEKELKPKVEGIQRPKRNGTQSSITTLFSCTN